LSPNAEPEDDTCGNSGGALFLAHASGWDFVRCTRLFIESLLKKSAASFFISRVFGAANALVHRLVLEEFGLMRCMAINASQSIISNSFAKS